ncbi:adenylyl-sulfate kinase [Nocardioides lianchengensis]|uniref:Adenylyl-sulfate kinase n=1 Tax=Nocardioides lianchengensis TaxID=1045774 RepID=A0A1G7AYR4_9ACTN|nr:adenylyl-sulfate kinase [Nocardioides lianchengensis]NYG13346.1 sulfate adenylyltransferase [Nocardioides lianchengensis]SDE19727.1 sulfate adenylyltransferase [Nocardioides lianchengensis]
MPPAVPQHCPTPRELDDLELLVSGALHPTQRYDEPGSPVTLALPPAIDAAAREAGQVELVDPEGLPLARVAVPGGEIEPLSHAQFGPFRHLYLSPATARAELAGRTFVPVTDALTSGQVEALRAHGPVALVALVGTGTPELSSVALVRATLRAAELLDDAAVLAVPLASHDDPEADHELGVRVLATYAGPDPVVGLVEPGEDDDLPAGVAEIVEEDQPAPDRRGLVLFFTGLSGSGKSTLARALMDRLLEQGGRTLTSLDGDVVRRNLSAGLTFSKEDRETNIRRIGWVAAEISRHGGVAVCSPIAPYDETRQQVRAMVDDAGGAFFLVHVATPLEECERRDRKGLYAKARRGEIPEFTGISSPYEEPADADVVVDTTGRTIEDALDDVIAALRTTGFLDLTTPVLTQGAPPLVEHGGPPGPDRVETPAPDDGVRAEGVSRLGASAPRTSTSGGEAAPLVGQGGTPGPDRVETPAPDSRPGAEEADAPLNVLFVCTANICRSPFMELLARHLAGPDANVVFSGAGTHGFQAHAMDDVMAATLAPRGVTDVASFASRPLDRDLLEQADVVLTAEAAHRTFILDDHPQLFRKVFTLGQFAETVQALDPDLSGRELVTEAARRRGAADAGLDVRDPYRQGAEAAETAAAGIERLLRVVVPALLGARETAR